MLIAEEDASARPLTTEQSTQSVAWTNMVVLLDYSILHQANHLRKFCPRRSQCYTLSMLLKMPCFVQ